MIKLFSHKMLDRLSLVRREFKNLDKQEKESFINRISSIHDDGLKQIEKGDVNPENLFSLLACDWMDLILMSLCWLADQYTKQVHKDDYEKARQEATPTTHEFVNSHDELYAVITVAKNLAYGGCRIPVVCNHLDRAREIIEKNEGDIWECSYDFAVIQSVSVNHLYEIGKMYWYHWNDLHNRYEAIEPLEIDLHQLFLIG